MNYLRKVLMAGAIILGALTVGFNAFGVETAPAIAAELSPSNIKDVTELLKFVRSAKPELFEEFAGAFIEVGASCSQNDFKSAYATQVREMISEIESELPETNKGLLSKIKLAEMFGGKKIYHPTFIDKEHVRENILSFLAMFEASYANKDFQECTRLVAIGQDIYSTSIVALR